MTGGDKRISGSSHPVKGKDAPLIVDLRLRRASRSMEE